MLLHHSTQYSTHALQKKMQNIFKKMQQHSHAMHFSFFFVLAVLVAASLTALREVESSAQTFIQTYVHTDIHTYMHAYTYIHIYIHTYMHVYAACKVYQKCTFFTELIY